MDINDKLEQELPEGYKPEIRGNIGKTVSSDEFFYTEYELKEINLDEAKRILANKKENK